jgi:hypothetical protein
MTSTIFKGRLAGDRQIAAPARPQNGIDAVWLQ